MAISTGAWSKQTRKVGMQTYRNVKDNVPPEFRENELQYIDLRDAYSELVSHIKQFEEMRRQSLADGDVENVKHAASRIDSIRGEMRHRRDFIIEAGNRSYAEVFYYVAQKLLNQPTRACPTSSRTAPQRKSGMLVVAVSVAQISKIQPN